MDFIIGALVVAVLLSDRIGMPDEVQRRFYQVILGLVLAALAAAVATLALPVQDLSPILSSGREDEGGVQDLRQHQMLLAALGMALALAGFLLARRFETLYLGLVLAGAVVLVGVRGIGSSFPALLYDTSGAAGTASNAGYAGVIAIGALALLYYGYREWEDFEDEQGVEDEPSP